MSIPTDPARWLALLVTWSVIALASVSNAAEPPLSFNRDIRPILADNCLPCHGPDRNARKADLRLDQRDAAIDAGAIAPGQPDVSALMARIESDDPLVVMPPPATKKRLDERQRLLLRRWISEGANYEPHWAFQSITRGQQVPAVPHDGNWITSPVDAYSLDKLRSKGWSVASPAAKGEWLRRASFDLRGLPPSLDELDQFLADESPDAFDAAVDRMLSSPAFGERMTGEWLDVARYADTFGYQTDRDMHVWPWRDWCVRAFNANLSYDQFIFWQTAGDLIPGATRDQKLATTFNRLHRQTAEGGSIEEEFRIAYVADRVATNGMAFLGLTLDCARCHEHKFDPISQQDFYRLAAFFDNIDEHGLYSHFTETAPTPALLLYESEQQAALHESLLGRIQNLEADLAKERNAAQQRFEQFQPPEIPLPQPTIAFRFDDLAAAGDYQPVPGKSGPGIGFGGDDAFVCKDAGAFGRTNSFSFSVWLKPGPAQPRQVILHRCVAAEDASYRGYALTLDSGHAVFSLVHFWPGNAIRVRTPARLPEGEWTHLAITYDGSSKAAGLRIYLNGAVAELQVERDRLTRDITYRGEWGDSGSPQLSLGARFRDVGFVGGCLDELMVFDRELSPQEVPMLSGSSPRSDDGQARAAQFEHFLLHHDAGYAAKRAELQAARREENDLVSQVRQIMVMQERTDRRPTHVLARGAYDAPREVVEPGTPASLNPLEPDWPRNRVGLATWMIDERNPLVSRVAVNRLWQLFFGRGLVATPGDFGSQGQLPTHPELLDWLARHFIDNGWDLKELCRRIVLSSTYRQSSNPALREYLQADPENKWLSRGPRHRLSAEQLRDQALAVSGLLVARPGGPGVFPYQPAGLWEESGTNRSYSQSRGENLYRRSLYTYWRRTAPPPTMISFDAAGREVCSAKRERTATPLQSLVLLNDPQFVEAARCFAERSMRENPGLAEQCLQPIFRALTCRPPTAAEADVLERFLREQLAVFRSHPDDAQALLAVGESTRDASLDPATHAALTVVAVTLLSFDECVHKR
jgi:cytochrome c553